MSDKGMAPAETPLSRRPGPKGVGPMSEVILAERIARDIGTEGIAEAVFAGEIDVAYGMYLLELLERDEG